MCASSVFNFFKTQNTSQSPGTVYKTVKNDIELAADRFPDQSMTKVKLAGRVGLNTNDFPLTRFKSLVNVGEKVDIGTPLMVDRHRSECMLTSSVSGRVSSIKYGRRRRLQSVVVDTGSTQQQQKATTVPNDVGGAKQCLQENGLWTAIRSRPFGGMANPNKTPAALFVTATRTDPMAPNVETVIKEFQSEFVAGLTLLGLIHPGVIYLCVEPDSERFLKEVSTGSESLILTVFNGTYPAGLPGTHIHMVDPVKQSDRPVWHIDYQDVISFGHLQLRGIPWNHRVISLVGPAVRSPKTMIVPLGASIEDISAGELLTDDATVFSGAAVSAGLERREGDFLGRFHNQITAVMTSNKTAPNQQSIGAAHNETSNRDSIIPFEALEHCLPKDMLVVPFLRSLLVGDVEQAKKLGALSFVEEDLALARLLCCSGANYPQLLRRMLDDMAEEQT